jgi:hypothetical protein
VRLTKDIECAMETFFVIKNKEAKLLLPPGLKLYTFLTGAFIQIGALKYRNILFEGRSLGPSTDVFIAVAVKLQGRTTGLCVDIYNNNEETVSIINKNWFFNKKYAEIDWSQNQSYFSVHLYYNKQSILEYKTKILSKLFILPLLKKRAALTINENTLYTFDNTFNKSFGFYASPKIKSNLTLEWFEKLHKIQLYSIIWFKDTLNVMDAKPVAK